MKRIDVAIAVVTRGAQILICQRKSNDTFGGLWEFPGGKCEPGEDLAACLARELMEELAIETRIVRKLTAIRHDYPHTQITLHPFLCEHGGAEPKAIACQQLKWVDAGELSAYQFPPANESLLKEVSCAVSSGNGE
ncbi:MAG TPA: 8-oxo-dGTP diphosphatase MutT [Tepidisphaeraceae bacterium]|jgi:mutator protein MutT|nr:8-oxo-dGTP diphosphatase MutT [Tepidisphaeraceae bacterium]